DGELADRHVGSRCRGGLAAGRDHRPTGWVAEYTALDQHGPEVVVDADGAVVSELAGRGVGPSDERPAQGQTGDSFGVHVTGVEQAGDARRTSADDIAADVDSSSVPADEDLAACVVGPALHGATDLCPRQVGRTKHAA